MRSIAIKQGVALSVLLTLMACGKPKSPDVLAPIESQPGETPSPEAPETPTPELTQEPATEASPTTLPYPEIRGTEFRGEKNFSHLMNHYTAGKVEPQPWAGFWWPYTSNGIASGGHGSGFSSRLRGYSPAGKYDAARGGTTQAQAWEIKNHGRGVRGVQGWWGHCNGWSAAAALFPEPQTDVRVNGIEFTVADIKALVTEAAMEVSADFFGDRVDWYRDYNSPKYGDTVPNQYFMVLANYIGKQKKGVLIDRYTGDQVWNQPVVGYRFEYPKAEDVLPPDPAAPNIHRINVTSTLWWARDDVSPGVITSPFDWVENEYFQQRTLKMELWLDGPVVFGPDGKIQSSGDLVMKREGEFLLGGVWRNGEGWLVDAHPDYMWVPFSVLKPTQYANPHLDIEWIKKHILSGGVDDPSVTPSSIPAAPTSGPTSFPSGLPDWDWDGEGNGNTRPTRTPTPTPTSTFIPAPAPAPAPNPNPGPTNPGGGGDDWFPW